MKQPEALKLAAELVQVHNGHADEGPTTFSEAAAELRRLHEVNRELVDALWVFSEHNALYFGEHHNTVIQSRAALAKQKAGGAA